MPGNHEYVTPHAWPVLRVLRRTGGRTDRERATTASRSATGTPSRSTAIFAVGPGSAQATWLRTDLASSRARCTIAYWHHPLFTSGPNGDTQSMREFWRILYDARRGYRAQRARAHVRAIRAAESRWPYRSGERHPAVRRRNRRRVSLSAEDAAPEQRETNQLVWRAETDAVLRSISVGIRSGRRRPD